MERADCTFIVIDNKNWIITGGMTYYDDPPTDAARFIQLIKYTGLDRRLEESIEG